MQRSTFCKGVYNKYYVDEAYDTIFVKTTNGLSRFFRDHVDYIIILVLIRKSNQRGYQGKKTNRKYWFLSLYLFRALCHINLFIYSSIILYHERISNINYTFSWRICNLFAGDKLASKWLFIWAWCFSSYHCIIKQF
jgi:NADH:ubiquinone oxidoreductase subunit 5 (subunit L)/multisubunit Na+/H+ antiporter MnhA subunit